MKSILAALAVILTPLCAFAQSITLQAGFLEKSNPFTIPLSTGGVDVDSSGDLYYLSGSPSDTHNTSLDVASLSGTTWTSHTLVDYGTPTYGSFVKLSGTALYYGDSVNSGNINRASTAIPGGPAPTPTIIGNIPDNYDLAISGTLEFVSADVSGSDNEVYYVGTSGTAAPKAILDTGDAASGPVAVTPSGSLIYGESGYQNSGGIYIFTAAQLQQAMASGTAIQLSKATPVISGTQGDPGNSALSVGPNDELFQAFNSLSGASTLTLFNLNSGYSQLNSYQLIGSQNDGYYFAGIADADNELTVADTDGFSTTEFLQIVPEPGSVFLEAAAFVLLLLTVKRRRGALQRR